MASKGQRTLEHLIQAESPYLGMPPASIRELVRMMRLYVNVGLHKQRLGLRKYHDSFVGSEAVDWMVKSKLVPSRENAVHLCSRLFEARLIMHVKGNKFFSDSSELFYLIDPVAGSDLEPISIEIEKCKKLIQSKMTSSILTQTDIKTITKELRTEDFELPEISRAFCLVTIHDGVGSRSTNTGLGGRDSGGSSKIGGIIGQRGTSKPLLFDMAAALQARQSLRLSSADGTKLLSMSRSSTVRRSTATQYIEKVKLSDLEKQGLIKSVSYLLRLALEDEWRKSGPPSRRGPGADKESGRTGGRSTAVSEAEEVSSVGSLGSTDQVIELNGRQFQRMLKSLGIHVSSKGARLLFYDILADFPGRKKVSDYELKGCFSKNDLSFFIEKRSELENPTIVIRRYVKDYYEKVAREHRKHRELLLDRIWQLFCVDSSAAKGTGLTGSAEKSSKSSSSESGSSSGTNPLNKGMGLSMASEDLTSGGRSGHMKKSLTSSDAMSLAQFREGLKWLSIEYQPSEYAFIFKKMCDKTTGVIKFEVFKENLKPDIPVPLPRIANIKAIVFDSMERMRKDYAPPSGSGLTRTEFTKADRQNIIGRISDAEMTKLLKSQRDNKLKGTSAVKSSVGSSSSSSAKASGRVGKSGASGGRGSGKVMGGLSSASKRATESKSQSGMNKSGVPGSTSSGIPGSATSPTSPTGGFLSGMKQFQEMQEDMFGDVFDAMDKGSFLDRAASLDPSAQAPDEVSQEPGAAAATAASSKMSGKEDEIGVEDEELEEKTGSFTKPKVLSPRSVGSPSIDMTDIYGPPPGIGPMTTASKFALVTGAAAGTLSASPSASFMSQDMRKTSVMSSRSDEEKEAIPIERKDSFMNFLQMSEEERLDYARGLLTEQHKRVAAGSGGDETPPPPEDDDFLADGPAPWEQSEPQVSVDVDSGDHCHEEFELDLGDQDEYNIFLKEDEIDRDYDPATDEDEEITEDLELIEESGDAYHTGDEDLDEKDGGGTAGEEISKVTETAELSTVSSVPVIAADAGSGLITPSVTDSIQPPTTTTGLPPSTILSPSDSEYTEVPDVSDLPSDYGTASPMMKGSFDMLSLGLGSGAGSPPAGSTDHEMDEVSLLRMRTVDALEKVGDLPEEDHDFMLDEQEPSQPPPPPIEAIAGVSPPPAPISAPDPPASSSAAATTTESRIAAMSPVVCSSTTSEAVGGTHRTSRKGTKIHVDTPDSEDGGRPMSTPIVTITPAADYSDNEDEPSFSVRPRHLSEQSKVMDEYFPNLSRLVNDSSDEEESEEEEDGLVASDVSSVPPPIPSPVQTPVPLPIPDDEPESTEEVSEKQKTEQRFKTDRDRASSTAAAASSASASTATGTRNTTTSVSSVETASTITSKVSTRSSKVESPGKSKKKQKDRSAKKKKKMEDMFSTLPPIPGIFTVKRVKCKYIPKKEEEETYYFRVYDCPPVKTESAVARRPPPPRQGVDGRAQTLGVSAKGSQTPTVDVSAPPVINEGHFQKPKRFGGRKKFVSMTTLPTDKVLTPKSSGGSPSLSPMSPQSPLLGRSQTDSGYSSDKPSMSAISKRKSTGGVAMDSSSLKRPTERKTRKKSMGEIRAKMATLKRKVPAKKMQALPAFPAVKSYPMNSDDDWDMPISWSNLPSSLVKDVKALHCGVYRREDDDLNLIVSCKLFLSMKDIIPRSRRAGLITQSLSYSAEKIFYEDSEEESKEERKCEVTLSFCFVPRQFGVHPLVLRSGRTPQYSSNIPVVLTTLKTQFLTAVEKRNGSGDYSPVSKETSDSGGPIKPDFMSQAKSKALPKHVRDINGGVCDYSLVSVVDTWHIILSFFRQCPLKCVDIKLISDGLSDGSDEELADSLDDLSDIQKALLLFMLDVCIEVSEWFDEVATVLTDLVTVAAPVLTSMSPKHSKFDGFVSWLTRLALHRLDEM